MKRKRQLLTRFPRLQTGKQFDITEENKTNKTQTKPKQNGVSSPMTS